MADYKLSLGATDETPAKQAVERSIDIVGVNTHEPPDQRITGHVGTESRQDCTAADALDTTGSIDRDQ